MHLTVLPLILSMRGRYLMTSTRVFTITLFISATGIFTGIFMERYMPSADRQFLASSLEAFLSAPSSTFFISLIANLVFLAVILAAGLHPAGKLLSMGALSLKAMATGFSGSVIAGLEGPGHLFTFLLPALIYMAIYTLAAAASISRKGPASININDPYLRLAAALTVLLFLTTLMEALLLKQ